MTADNEHKAAPKRAHTLHSSGGTREFSAVKCARQGERREGEN